MVPLVPEIDFIKANLCCVFYVLVMDREGILRCSSKELSTTPKGVRTLKNTLFSWIIASFTQKEPQTI